MLGLAPDAAEVGSAVLEEGFGGNNGVDVFEGEGAIGGHIFFKDLVVKATDEVLANELEEVGLTVGEVDDFVEGILGVVQGKVISGLGEEFPGGRGREEADFARFDTAEEGIPVVFCFFLEGIESC